MNSKKKEYSLDLDALLANDDVESQDATDEKTTSRNYSVVEKLPIDLLEEVLDVVNSQIAIISDNVIKI